MFHVEPPQVLSTPHGVFHVEQHRVHTARPVFHVEHVPPIRPAPSGRKRQRTRCTSPRVDVVPRARQRLGHVLRHGRRHEHLLRPGDQLGQPVAPADVELREDVVEHQHRLAAGPSPSARSSSYEASRSASANDHDSPCDA